MQPRRFPRGCSEGSGLARHLGRVRVRVRVGRVHAPVGARRRGGRLSRRDRAEGAAAAHRALVRARVAPSAARRLAGGQARVARSGGVGEVARPVAAVVAVRGGLVGVGAPDLVGGGLLGRDVGRGIGVGDDGADAKDHGQGRGRGDEAPLFGHALGVRGSLEARALRVEPLAASAGRGWHLDLDRLVLLVAHGGERRMRRRQVLVRGACVS
mmetsp:Transcript_2218/g.4940  ORF Transcript_2218/g.4940 Transcript_2218/m.4940 type:complete len:212 (-) Transcript_2218:37-672(-)